MEYAINRNCSRLLSDLISSINLYILARSPVVLNEIESKMNEIPSMGLMFGDRKISVLKYADDLVLCAKTSEGLQAGLNALYEFCTTNSLTVNTEKSKVMYVSSKKSKKLLILT